MIQKRNANGAAGRGTSSRLQRQREIDQRNTQAQGLMRTDPTQAAALAREALESARAVNYTRGIAAALRWLGNAYIGTGQYPVALPLLMEGLDLARRLRDRDAEVACGNGVGVALMRLGDFDGAVEHLQAALTVTGPDGEPFARMTLFANLANVCVELGQPERAVEYARQAIEVMTAVPDGDALSRMPRVNLGAYLAQIGQREAALEQLRKARRIMQCCADRPGEARVLCVLGETHLDLGLPAEARPLIEEALQLARASGVTSTEAGALHNLARAHEQAGELALAERVRLQALELARQTGEVRTLRLVHTALANQYERAGELARALHHLREAHRVESEHYRSAAEQRAQAVLVRMRVAEAQREAHAQRVRNLELMEANRRIATRNADAEAKSRAAQSLKSYDLSEREVKVLGRLGRGATNQQIAEALGLSPYTVRDHVSVILSKLGVSSRTEAAALAVKNGWI